MIEKVLVHLNAPVLSFEDEVFRLFIELENQTKVAAILNKTGRKSTEGKSFTPKDIGLILKNGHETVPREVFDFANRIPIGKHISAYNKRIYS